MLISVITVNYNNAAGLQKTMASVCGQTFRDFEYIVIDGGSTDESVAIIKNYEQKLAFWVSEKDEGIYSAMNKGIQHAKGEYCYFLNSGDLFYDEQVLATIFSLPQKEDTIYGNYIRGNKPINYPDKLSATFLAKSTICHQAMFIRRALFQQFGTYKEDLRLVADWEFLCRTVLEHKTSFNHVNTLICIYDITGQSSDPSADEILTKERWPVIEKINPLRNGYYLNNLFDALHNFNKKEVLRLLFKIKWLQTDLSDTGKVISGIATHFWLFLKNLPRKFKRSHAF